MQTSKLRHELLVALQVAFFNFHFSIFNAFRTSLWLACGDFFTASAVGGIQVPLLTTPLDTRPHILYPRPAMTNLDTNKSAALFERAQRSIPGGVNSPVRAFRAVGRSPLFIKSALG